MFVRVLKDLKNHPGVAEVVRTRGKVSVILNSAAGWTTFDGSDLVEGKNAAEILAVFNDGKICLASDLATPKEIIFTSKLAWGNPRRYHVQRIRAKLCGVEAVGPNYAFVELLSESDRPPFPWAETPGESWKCGIAWFSLAEEPERYGLKAADVAGIHERLSTHRVHELRARLAGAAR